MPLVVIGIAAAVSVAAVLVLNWPWWAGVVVFLIAAPLITQTIARGAMRTGLGPSLLRTGAPPRATPEYLVYDAYAEFAEASRRELKDEAAVRWSELRERAGRANASRVLAAMDAVESWSGDSFVEARAKVAVHELRLAVVELAERAR